MFSACFFSKIPYSFNFDLYVFYNPHQIICKATKKLVCYVTPF